jgi:hypothetical protein
MQCRSSRKWVEMTQVDWFSSTVLYGGFATVYIGAEHPDDIGAMTGVARRDNLHDHLRYQISGFKLKVTVIVQMILSGKFVKVISFLKITFPRLQRTCSMKPTAV